MKSHQGEITENPNDCTHDFTEQLADHSGYFRNARRCKACGIMLINGGEYGDDWKHPLIHTGVLCKVCKIQPTDYYDAQTRTTPTFLFFWKDKEINTDEIRKILIQLMRGNKH